MNDRFSEILRSRRTVAAFRPELPPHDLVELSLELACWAPNHHKTEPWRFFWLGRETALAIIELNATLVAAKKGPEAAAGKRKQWSTVPGWLAVTCVRSGDALQLEEDYAACCCAVQNLTLALWNHGIGSKWSTGDVTRHPEYFRLLGISPDEHRSVGLIWYGYPDVIPEQHRKPLADVLCHLP